MTTRPPAIRAWLFDFDNTLAALEREVDWAGGRRRLEAFLRAEFTARGLDPAVFAEIPRGNLPLYAALHSRWLRDGERNPIADGGAILARASAMIEELELAGVDRAAPLPGAIDLLRALARNRRAVALVTSNSSRTASRWLARYQLADCVRAIVGRDSMLALKPSPEMVVRALELCAADPGAALFVGDSEADYRAATAVGVRFAAIAPDENARESFRLRGVDHIFASPLELGARLADAPTGEFDPADKPPN